MKSGENGLIGPGSNDYGSSKPIDIPRRHYMPEWSNAEHAITNALVEVEKVGADTLLTDAVNLLSQAQDKVCEYYEKKAK